MAEQKEKSLTDWSIDETLQYIQSCIGNDERDDKKLAKSVEYLASKMNDNDHIAAVIQNNGVDLIFNVMADTLELDDINLQKNMCTIFIVLGSNPATKQSPAQKNGFNHLANQLKGNMDDPEYCSLVCNAICNLCHDNQVHRRFVMESNIITAIIAAMDAHRGKEDGQKVHESACMAIRNIASSPEGQAAVGPAGLKAILDGVKTYYKTAGIVKSSLGVLCNLCALGTNGAAFISSGALALWTRIYDNAKDQMAVRLGCAAMIHNLSSNKESCVLLAVDEEGLALIIGKMLRDSPSNSPLFANSLKAVAALMFTLPPNKQLKVQAMDRMIGAGLLDIFNVTLQQSKNRELEELVATITVSIVQTSVALAQKVAAGRTAEYLVAYLNDPSPQTQHVCFTTWFYVTDNYENQVQLIKAGLVKVMAGGWYVHSKEDTMRVGLSLILKLLSNTKNYNEFRPFCDEFEKMAAFCAKKGGDIGKQCKALKEDIGSVRKGGK